MSTSPKITTPVFDPDRIANFRATGYLVASRMLPPAIVSSLSRWADEVAALPEVPGRQAVYHAQSMQHHGRCLVQRIERVTPFHDGFRRLTEALVAPAGQLLGTPAVLLAERLDFLLPGRDGCAPHRDAQSPWMSYADAFVSVVVGIDPASEDNACLEIASGQHRHGLHRPSATLDAATIAALDFKPVCTEPGDLVFLDPYTPYRIRRNRSNLARRQYRALFNRASAGDHQVQFYADKHHNDPPDIDRRLPVAS